MKIHLHSHHFTPSVGGIESMSRALAEQWHRMGHEVIVTTTTPQANLQGQPYEVVVSPGFLQMRDFIRRSDIYIQNNISLRQLPPWVLTGTPIFIVTQIWLEHGKRHSVPALLKRLILSFGFVHNIAISHAIAQHLPIQSAHIPNAYRDELFVQMKGPQRQNDVVFLGRFVSDKGADILVEALAILKKDGQGINATFVGSGPEEEDLKRQVTDNGLQENVAFKGKMEGLALVEELNRHRFMVVPSRWDEPFGIVALEGLACGCIPVVSNCGGLLEAVGECGYSFQSGDAKDLARVLASLSQNKNLEPQLFEKRLVHLKKQSAKVVAERYLEEFSKR